MASESPGRRPEVPVRVPMRPEPTQTVASGPPTVDELGEASFPASDPPPAWTWEIEPPVRNGSG
jgi:hypothetical protein